MFTREIEFESVGKSLLLSQESEGEVGCVVWDAAIVLAKCLEHHTLLHNQQTTNINHVVLSGSHVVELGAGTGCVGLAAALLGASRVTITDLPQFLPLMNKNILQNQDKFECAVEARELTWGNTEQGVDLSTPDIIVVADCIYYQESLEPLVSTLGSLCGRSTTIILSYEERTTGNKPQLQHSFFELMDKHFKRVQIPSEEQHELYRSSDIHLFKFHLR
ncbi:protein-lysine methyltransferase METTL21D-like isoform X2 [Homarus americanus]|nr:protein-lysine methyltransferase METTL21D-like isoform X2 [Homarus americanus]XP_042225321.1 protein-lysine methyltransferase METTL21D-like isoform X2 [Homarus americanus]